MAFFRNYNTNISFFKSCLKFLGQNKDLIKFPLITMCTSVISMAVILGAGVDIPKLWHALATHSTTLQRLGENMGPYFNTSLWHQHGVSMLIIVLVLLLLLSFVTLYINSALLSCILHRLRGEQMTMGAAFASIKSRLPAILGWSLLNATVGTIIKSFENSRNFIQRICFSFLGFAWTLASYFVMPTLIMENIGPITALKKSFHMFGKGWRMIVSVNFLLALALVIPFALMIAIIHLKLSVPVWGFAVLLVIAFLGFLLIATYGAIFNTIVKAALFLHFFEKTGNDYFGSAEMDRAMQKR